MKDQYDLMCRIGLLIFLLTRGEKMICIGTAKELSKADGLPDAVRADIAATVGILDSCYGADRDMIRDLGGFVGIVGTVGDFQKLFSEWHIDVRSDVCELSMIIDGYVKKLFILNPDFAVILYIKEELL